MSSLLKSLAPAKDGWISSKVGILWGHRFTASFRCLGSRHTLMLPSCFVLYTRLEHQFVCSFTLLMMPMFSILVISALILGRRLMLHFWGRSICGTASGFNRIFAGSLKWPMVSNSEGYSCFRSVMDEIGLRTWTVSTRWQVIDTSFSSSQLGSPRMAGLGTSIT